MRGKTRHTIMRPCRNLTVLEHALRNDSPMLAVGGSHLRDAMTCAVEIVLAILIRHYGVVDKRSIYNQRLLCTRLSWR